MARRVLFTAVAAACLVCVFSFVSGESLFRFTVVENDFCNFDYYYFPQTLFGQTYLPHFVFEFNADWGFQSSWNTVNRTFTLYTGTKMIIFDVSAGKAYDNEQTYSQRAVRNNIDGINIFMLPAEFVCEYFAIKLRTYETDVGTMYRLVKTSTVADYLFVGVYRYTIQQKYNDYMAALLPPTPSPSPSSPSSPSPSSGVVSPSVRPSVSPSPSSSPTPEPEPTIVYLTVNGQPGELMGKFADYLSIRGIAATFFFPPDSIADDPETARHVSATFSVGLLLEGKGDLPSLAVRGNDMLDDVSFYRTRLLRAPDAETPDLYALSDAGVRVWRDTSLQCEWTDVNSVLSALSLALESTPAVISVPLTQEALDMLPSIIGAIPPRYYTLLPLTPSSRDY